MKSWELFEAICEKHTTFRLRLELELLGLLSV
jgi:hypothetical protein